ncbi:flagellin lysine-N-methylase [Bacillus sp. FSL K6-0268]|uniref:flagellin lysine-N-methylase n=1 Tax=Bacillus sp. FSL K6-0268 TaxID=2921449 RepID=UPI0030F5BB2C
MKQNFFTSKYTSQFSCIGSKCEDNCCQGDWGVFISKEEYEGYQRLDSENATNLLQYVEKNDNATSNGAYATIQFNSAGRCSFLTEEKLCQIQLDHGLHTLCDTCKTYPRVIQKVQHSYYETCHLSCPEVARLVLLANTPFDWITSIDSNLKTTFVGSSDIDRNLNYVKKMHKHITYFLTQKEYTLTQRIRIIGIFVNRFCHALQNNIGMNKAMKLAQKQINIDLKNKNENMFEFKISLLLHVILKIENALQSHDVSPRFKECYDAYYQPFFTKHEQMLENYCSYYFQHQLFPYDGNMLARNFLIFNIEFSILKLILVGISASHRGLSEDIIIQLFQSYSKIFQHYPGYRIECINKLHDELLNYTTDYSQVLNILINE